MTEIESLKVEVPDAWGVSTIGNVTSKIGSGATPRGGSAVYVETGSAFIRSQNVLENSFKRRGLAHLSEAAAHALRGVTVAPNDVLINITGDSILRTCVVPDSVLPARVNQHVSIVRSNGAVDPLFLQKWLTLPLMKSHMLGHSSGGTRKAITKGHLEGFPIPLPPLPEQRGIAKTLGAIDDKILSIVNQQRIGEDLIRAIVDKALDEASRPDDETLGDLCSLIKQGIAADKIGADENYIGFEHMPRGSIFLTEWSGSEGLGSNKSRFNRGDILFGKLRPYFKKVGVAPIGGVCSTDILVIRPNDVQDTALIAMIASSSELIDSLSAAATGTRMPRASWADMAAWRIPVLTPDERASVASKVGPTLDLLLALTNELVRLRAIRGALVPELMLGRIRVAEAIVDSESAE